MGVPILVSESSHHITSQGGDQIFLSGTTGSRSDMMINVGILDMHTHDAGKRGASPYERSETWSQLGDA